MANFTAVYDACVLHPAPLRDLLIQLATFGMFRARWTDKIHEEWIVSLLERRKDLKRAQLERTRQLMDNHVLDCLVTEYESLINSVTLPDENDRHVVAAAIKCHAEVIVTYNLKDFPVSAIARYDMEAQHPDEFISNLIDLSQSKVCEAAKKCRTNLKAPPISVEKYLEILSEQHLPNTVSFLRDMSELI